MKERPIIFSAPMVRAILDGRKTQTRRAVKYPVAEGKHGWHPTKTGFEFLPGGSDRPVCPYGKIGDRLWVRESWHIEARRQSESHLNMTVAYRPCSPRAVENHWPQDSKDFDLPTDTPIPSPNVPTFGKNGIRWRPSIHMPRWASRITLEITSVRVERLQDISEEDAKAEGPPSVDKDGLEYGRDRVAFMSLWDRINFDRGVGWGMNPWVWVIKFRRLEK